MTSTPPDVVQSSPGTKETLLSALHSAMQTNVKVNQDSLSSPTSSPTKDNHEAHIKKLPPMAPPPFEDAVALRRQTRAQSMIVPSASRPSDFGLNVPGQKDGQLVSFDPREEFRKLISSEPSSTPRSSLQLEESSTILHPSQFKQIVALDTTGMDPRYRRRNTISGPIGGSRKVPSQYRDFLFQKPQPAARPPQTTPAAKPQPTQTPAASADSQLTALTQPTEGPKPTAPKRRHQQPQPTPDDDEEEETESDEEDEKDNDGADKPDAAADNAAQEESLHVYGLEYEGGLIDFVEHPATAPEDQPKPPAQTATPSSPPSEEVQEMERAMSPQMSS